MKNEKDGFSIEKESKGRFGLYYRLSSGNHVCVFIGNSKEECEKRRKELNGGKN